MNKLILDLCQLTGIAREVLSAHVQKRLIEMGFLSAQGTKDCAFLQFPSIIIGQETHPDYATRLGAASRFDATDRAHMDACGYRVFCGKTDIESFLANAKSAMAKYRETPITRTIQGVECVISPHGVVMDYTGLLLRVEREAHEVGRKHFGAVENKPQ